MKKYLLFIMAVVLAVTIFNVPLRCEKVFAMDAQTGTVAVPVCFIL